MKKLLLILISALILAASGTDKEIHIYSTILNAIFPNKKVIYVWLDNPAKRKIFQKIKGVRVVKNHNKADILILYKSFDVPTDDKIIFADGYLVFEHFKNRLVGGFYWQKGRPNLVFIKKNLKDHNISLPANLKDYIEDDM
ncbi:hypothetical protein NNO_1485 [Hydrogenimonas sp.]|nr:hypothetical protein NNO_1485 [Hydrogenimonas sp.]